MVLLPFLVFWILIFLARNELGLKKSLVAVGIWGALLAVLLTSGFSPYIFVIAQSLLDIVLILIIFGGDIRIG